MLDVFDILGALGCFDKKTKVVVSVKVIGAVQIINTKAEPSTVLDSAPIIATTSFSTINFFIRNVIERISCHYVTDGLEDC